ncbi:MAG: hypothetical protein WA323_06305 [Candidatus Nitrosopolaris sp.]
MQVSLNISPDHYSYSMARYPTPLSEQEWNFLMDRLSQPQTEEQKRRISEMADNGRKIKIHA